MTVRLKSPEAEFDWPISYPLETGETITGSTWNVQPVETGGLAIKTGSEVIDGLVTACIVTGGIFRHVYQLNNVITTSAGRTYSQTVTIRIGAMEPT